MYYMTCTIIYYDTHTHYLYNSYTMICTKCGHEATSQTTMTEASQMTEEVTARPGNGNLLIEAAIT